MSHVPVIDISQHQGQVDAAKMAAAGVRGVIVRAGNGVRPDAMFVTNARNISAAGMKVGAYWFLNPKASDAVTQAGKFAEDLKQVPLDLPPMLDIEWYSDEFPKGVPMLAPSDYAAWIRQFIIELERLQPLRPTIYTSASFWNAWVGSAAFGDHDVILARYLKGSSEIPTPDGWAQWALGRPKRPASPIGWTNGWAGWQFSAQGNAQAERFGAQSQDIDLNIVTVDAWARWTGGPAPEPVAVVTVDPAIDDEDTEPPPNRARLIKCDDGDPAVFVVNGITAAWATEQSINVGRMLQTVDDDVHLAPRAMLKDLILLGPL